MPVISLKKFAWILLIYSLPKTFFGIIWKNIYSFYEENQRKDSLAYVISQSHKEDLYWRLLFLRECQEKPGKKFKDKEVYQKKKLLFYYTTSTLRNSKFFDELSEEEMEQNIQNNTEGNQSLFPHDSRGLKSPKIFFEKKTYINCKTLDKNFKYHV